jgi:acyl phosphate:glycerol-3-phosphate acyltransferase
MWLQGLIVVSAYLLGAVPFGLLLARSVAGVDVRAAGSGNIGATNVARSAGKTLGIVTLALDTAKGAAPVLVADHVFHFPLEVVAAAGLATVVGHVFPIYLAFKGGKGVATSLGVFAAIAPIPTLIAAAVFIATFAIARVVSLGSLLASLTLLAVIVAHDGRREVIALAVVIVVIVFARHRGNIERLVKRSENKI